MVAASIQSRGQRVAWYARKTIWASTKTRIFPKISGMSDQEKIRRLTAAGWTESRIAKHMGRSRFWLSARRAEFGLERPARPNRKPKPLPKESLIPFRTATQEAKNLLPLLHRADAVETFDTVRRLIGVSDGERQFLEEHIDRVTAARIFIYRERIGEAFEKLICERTEP
jgi:hypothetical protein